MKAKDAYEVLLKRGLLIIGIAMSGVGIFGIIDGVRSLVGGGYADNIVLGAMMLMFGLPFVIAYALIRIEEIAK